MNPDTNPLTTAADGQYQWDVLAGTYRVHVEAPGYYSSDSMVVTVPPAVDNLNIGLTHLPDNTSPTTTLTVGTPKYTDSTGHSYVNSSTLFTLSPHDETGGSGVASTAYKIYNSSYSSGWQSYAAAFTLQLANGEYYVAYNSTDYAGNVEATKFTVTILDNSPPTTSNNYVDAWHTADFIVTLTASDSGCGVNTIYYRINDGTVKSTATDGQPTITFESATDKIEYWGIDNLGNQAAHTIISVIRLDKTAPTGSIVINGGADSTSSTAATLTLTVNDATSGVAQVRYSDDGTWDTEQWVASSATKDWTLPSGDGTKTVYFQIKDNAGLISQTYSDSIILNTQTSSSNSNTNNNSNPTPTPTPTPRPPAKPTPSPTATASAEPTPTPSQIPQSKEIPLFIYLVAVALVVLVSVSISVFSLRRRR
jgi:hypothetical protein